MFVSFNVEARSPPQGSRAFQYYYTDRFNDEPSGICRFYNIAATPTLENHPISPEELRYEDYQHGVKGNPAAPSVP